MSVPPQHSQVFVLGTGRCGTATVASLLDTIPGCAVGHEIDPKLLGEVDLYLNGRMSHDEMVSLLRRTRSRETIGGERLSGEANQRLSFVLPALTSAFPNARFIWLIRDGRTTVASMHHRKWYHPREASIRHPTVRQWTQSRVRGDVVGDFSAEDWAKLDPFGQCCWYWSYTNRLIDQEISRLNLEALPLKIEQLAKNLPRLARFLGLNEITEEVRVVDPASAGRPPSWRRWSPGQRQVFREFCGELMNEHYPGWENEMSFGPVDELTGILARVRTAVQEQLLTWSRPWRKRARAARRSRARSRDAEPAKR
jgi:hypothetical protein